MYKIWETSKIFGTLHKNVCFKITKRTKKKELEQTCPLFVRPCDDMPIRPKTGILFLHPGEPCSKEEIKRFLVKVEKDPTHKVAIQSIRGTDGCLLPCDEVIQKYETIGGYSPLLKWAATLAYGLEKRLDKDNRLFAPHKSIVAYRYVKPSVSKALKDFEIDKIKHLICISLDPHFYCARTAPAYEAIYRFYKKHKISPWSWTIIDRWPLNHMLCGLFAQTIQYELDALPLDKRKNPLLVFVGNGCYEKDVCKGDLYNYQVGGTVHNIMRILEFNYRYTLCWLHAERCSQKIVRPTLGDTLRRAYEDGTRSFVVVPVTYACECLDTLYEIDIAHIERFRKEWGCDVSILRSACPNDHQFMISALVRAIMNTFKKDARISEEFLSMCHGCKKRCCREYKKFFRKFQD